MGPDAAALVIELLASGASAMLVPTTVLDDPGALSAIDVLVVPAEPSVLTAQRVAACDRAAVRLVPVAPTDRAAAFSRALGLVPVASPDARAVLSSATSAPAELPARRSGGVTVVWGPHGAPGRSTLAVSLATELTRGKQDVCLVDADTHAPSLAPLLGLTEERPGIAGACRQRARSRFDEAEYVRIRDDVACGDGTLSVLTGITRPARWPELRGDRVADVITDLRAWNRHVVIDVAASVEADEELLSDRADVPRRNGATLAALESADRIVAVAAGDPLSLARFIRAVADVRAIAPETELVIVANRVRQGSIGLDPRGQIRRTLERFAGATAIHFLPEDRTAHDRALLTATAITVVAPRSPYVAGVRRLAAELVT